MTEHKRTKKNSKEENNTQRLRRVKAWINLAGVTPSAPGETMGDDHVIDDAVRFVFYWVAFEAAYGIAKKCNLGRSKDGVMKEFINRAVKIDEPAFKNLLDQHEADVNKILNLRAIYPDFWKRDANGKPPKGWKQRLTQEYEEFLKNDDTANKLLIVFERLKVARNQIFHGASSRRKSFGTAQVEHGLKILSAIIPKFGEVMEKNMTGSSPCDWKQVPYPRQHQDEKD